MEDSFSMDGGRWEDGFGFAHCSLPAVLGSQHATNHPVHGPGVRNLSINPFVS